MTKRYIKRISTKRKNYFKRTKKNNKNTKTKKNKYGGEPSEEYKQREVFRRNFTNLISQITNKNNSRNKIKDGINMLINFFNNNNMINILIPISSTGKYVDKSTGKGQIIDFVSPVTYIFDNFSGLNTVSDKDVIRILNSYFLNGGNFNNLSSRFKVSPFRNEVIKKRINNVRILLDKSNNFHIIEEGLDDDTKRKLSELIPNEQQIASSEEMTKKEEMPKEEMPEVQDVKLQLPYELPSNNDSGYDRNTVPEFWKPIFQNGEELLEIRNNFMKFYAIDRYTDDRQKRIHICDLLEKIIPNYLTKYTLGYRETAKTLVNTNILNCFITLFYGMILYKLYDTKQDYLFMFKGGRALQLSLVDIVNAGQYFSEDTDLLIIPNKLQGVNYDSDKMSNLSEHIGYLIKWIIPEEINVFISLPTNPKNTNKDITKVLYNDDKIFKPLSDIGFGDINEDIKKYFENLSYSPFYIDEFETITLFITPTIYDMLSEKLFYYAKYLTLKNQIEKNEPINEKKYSNLTKEDCDYLLYKFRRAIFKLVEAIIKKDYIGSEDLNNKETSRLILRGIIGNFEDYSNEEKENIIIDIFP